MVVSALALPARNALAANPSAKARVSCFSRCIVWLTRFCGFMVVGSPVFFDAGASQMVLIVRFGRRVMGSFRPQPTTWWEPRLGIGAVYGMCLQCLSFEQDGGIQASLGRVSKKKGKIFLHLNCPRSLLADRSDRPPCKAGPPTGIGDPADVRKGPAPRNPGHALRAGVRRQGLGVRVCSR